MSESFSAGDRAVIIRSDQPAWPVGKEVEIHSPLQPCRCSFFCDRMIHVIGYEGGLPVVAEPSMLRRLPPPSKQSVSTWDDLIVWRPKETTHV